MSSIYTSWDRADERVRACKRRGHRRKKKKTSYGSGGRREAKKREERGHAPWKWVVYKCDINLISGAIQFSRSMSGAKARWLFSRDIGRSLAKEREWEEEPDGPKYCPRGPGMKWREQTDARKRPGWGRRIEPRRMRIVEMRGADRAGGRRVRDAEIASFYIDSILCNVLLW